MVIHRNCFSYIKEQISKSDGGLNYNIFYRKECASVKKKSYILKQDLQGDVKKNFTTEFSQFFKVAVRKKLLSPQKNKMCNILQIQTS